MKIAYADPPYIGQAKRHYGDQPLCAEVDHRELIDRMCRDYDAWALSLSSPSLKTILPMCPDGVRVMAWVKPFCSFKGVNPAYAWEPVIVNGGREIKRAQMKALNRYTERDWVAANITMRRSVHGAKPAKFCRWLFDVLGALPGDEFHDLFPGSGAVTEAWRAYCGDQVHQIGLFAREGG